MGQQHPSRLPLRSLCRRTIGEILFQKDRGIGQTKAINGLLYIPHHKQILPIPGQCSKNGILNGVGVLILVHHHFLKPFPPAAGQLGRDAVLSHQKFGSQMLQIGKIQQPPPPFQGGIFRLKILHQGKQSPNGGIHRPHVLQKFGRAVGKKGRKPLHPSLAYIPQALDPLLSLRILTVSGRPQAGKFYLRLPCRTLPSVLQCGGKRQKAV